MKKQLLRFTFSILLIVSLTGAAAPTPIKGIYTEIWESGNTSGYSTFKTDLLMAELGPDYVIQTHFPHIDGEVISIREIGEGFPVVYNVLLHRNGRRFGGRDLALDTLVVSIDQLFLMPRSAQEAFAKAEHLPGGIIGRTSILGR